MRRLLLTTAVAAALVASGCGSDDAQDVAGQAQTEAEQAVEQLDAEAAVRETEEIVSDVTSSARELAEDPAADVDAQLADAEQRARELSEQVQTDLGDDQSELASTLSDANDQLAEAASDLQDAATSEDATRVVEQQLAQAGDQLQEAASQVGDAVPADARKRLDEARDELEQLQKDLPNVGG